MKRVWKWIADMWYWLIKELRWAIALWVIMTLLLIASGVQTIVINCKIPSLDRRLKAVQWQVDSICRLPDMIWMTRRDSMIAADTLPAVKP